MSDMWGGLCTFSEKPVLHLSGLDLWITGRDPTLGDRRLRAYLRDWSACRVCSR